MLYTTTVEPFTLELLKSLSAQTYTSKFLLVGGTSLALQIGHRKSVDLDFFTTSVFDTDELSELLRKEYNLQVLHQTKGSLIGVVDGVKVDFITFRYSFLYPVVNEGGIRLLNIKDIGPMKLDAIVGRGSKKDFYDLFYLLERFSLKELLFLYSEMYQHGTIFQVVKSLTWFEDAEYQIEPDIIDKNVTWEIIKDKIISEVTSLG